MFANQLLLTCCVNKITIATYLLFVYISSSFPSITPAENSKRQREETTFQKCSVTICKYIDISAIWPYSNSRELLTDNNYQMLLNRTFTNYEKAEYLLSILPKKDDFFGKFMLCLCETKSGTGHDNIVKALTITLKEVREDFAQGDAPST